MGRCHYCINCGLCRGEKPKAILVPVCIRCGHKNPLGSKTSRWSSSLASPTRRTRAASARGSAPAPRRSLCDEPVFPGGIDRGKRGPASRAEALLENTECAARRKKREAAPFSMQPPSFLPFTGGVCVRAARAGRGGCRPPVRAWKAEGSVEPSRRGGLQYLSRYDRGVRHGAAWRRVHSTRSPVGQKRPRIPVRARLP